MPPTRKRRTRTKSPTASEIVAPGGGTQNDVDKLAKNLGLPNDAVSAILNCEGSGVVDGGRLSRSSNSSGGDTSNPVVSSAWADFMSEEGFGEGGSGAADADTDKDAKRVKTDEKEEVVVEKQKPKQEASEPTTKAAAVIDESLPREYVLPIAPHKPTPGILAQTGTLDSTIVGRTKRTLTNVEDLQEPTILTFKSIFSNKKIAFIAASSVSAHSIVITTDGEAFAWGRNESSQCGLGYASACVPLPTKIAQTGKFIAAAVGKHHSILVEEGGDLYATGGNKYGQCGVNTSTDSITNWRKCIFEKSEDGDDVQVVQASCGENFTVILSSEGIIYSAGLAEFGQLGNGETGEHFVTANKLAFANANKFEKRSIFVHSLSDSGGAPNTEVAKKLTETLPDSDKIRIGSICCGKNHTVAIEAPIKNKTHSSRAFTWGCGGYGVLGHALQVDEYRPRMVGTIQGPLFIRNTATRAAAGANCSMILTENGHVYYCGKHRSVGEATMRPTLIDVLANNMHVVECVSGGYQSVFCGTQNGVTVSWGMGQTGELGYGSTAAKSSSKPKFVEKLDSCLVTDVACGYGHTLLLVRDDDGEDAAAVKKMKRIETDDLGAFVARVTK